MAKKVDVKFLSSDAATDAEVSAASTDDRNRSNHTGTQLASTISDFNTAVLNVASVVGSTAASSVSNTNTAGSATTAARSDHTHAGVASIAKTGSTALVGAVTLSAGTNVTLTQSGNDISIAATGGGGGGSGTVTDVSVVSANGFAGTVATSTTTPAITLSTTITGVLKGNGTAISAATAGTDYQAPITGGASTITTTDLTASRALASDASGKVAVSATTSTELGYVSGVTSAIQTQLNAKEPTLTKGNLTEATSSVLTITGGTGSVIGSGTSIQVKQASTTVDGYLSATDWNTFNNKQSAITGAATTITSSDLTASRALVSDGSGKVAASSVTSTTLGYLDATSSIQTQIDGKQATITGAATTITSSNLTASRALASDGSGKVAVSSVTSTELGYVSGVTSAIQTQIDGKAGVTSTTPSSVSSSNAVGTATTAARADHTHAGVASLAKSGSTALTGAVTLSAGSNITLTQSGNDISIASTASGGSGSPGVASSGVLTPSSYPATLASGDDGKVVLVNTTTAKTINLPAPASGWKITIKDISGKSGTNAITIARNGSEKIEYLASNYSCQSDYGIWTIVSDGTDYFLI